MIVKIGLKDLKVECIIGCNPEERIKKQMLSIDFEMELPSIVEVDALESTVDYGKISEHIEEFSQKNQFFLLEAFSQALLDSIFRTYPRIERIALSVRKPNAIQSCAYAYVTIDSKRGDHAS